MDKQSKKHGVGRFIAPAAIVLISAAAIFVLQAHDSKPFPLSEATAETPDRGTRPAAKTVLKSSLAGRWYPADANALRRQIAGLFQKADTRQVQDVIALILPHAGYAYSGQTAACGLKAVDRSYKRIIVIGPSHHAYMQEVLTVPRVTHYATPLGEVAVDTEFIDRLLEFPIFQNLSFVHRSEHNVQIELPLLQYRWKDFKFVPIVAGHCSPQTISRAASILKSMVDSETLVVASSDFVHYGPNYNYTPFDVNVPEQIKKLDMGAFEHIARLDAEGFLQYRQQTQATICGSFPIAILLSMLEKDTKVELVKYVTSGELVGDFTNSVSYLSAVFSGKWTTDSTVEPQAASRKLTDADRGRLLSIARMSIQYFFDNKRLPEAAELGVTVSEAMKLPRAAFVTLKKQDRLRGCIGDIFPRQPLCKSVASNAVNAAFRDARFVPLQESELRDVTIEISALTPPEPVSSYSDIRIGTDGVVLRKAASSAVFLPQVAPEQGWDLEQTLTQLSLKAGLQADDWKEGASFLVFQADVFGEQR